MANTMFGYFDYYDENGNKILLVLDDKDKEILRIAYKDIPDFDLAWLEDEDKYNNEIWNTIDRMMKTNYPFCRIAKREHK